MDYQLESNLESHNDSLALFQGPDKDFSILAKQWIEYRPINVISEGSVLEFNVPASSSDYINLKETRLQVKAKITKEDNSPVSREDLVAPSNLALQSIFSQVDLLLQQQPLYSVGTNYPYKAYLDAMLQSRGELSEAKLSSQLYYKENASNTDATDPNGGDTSIYLRWMQTRDGQIFDMSGPLYLDMFDQSRLLLNGVPLQIKLWPSKNAFRLMSDTGGYKLQIVDASLFLCMTKVHSGVLLAHSHTLKDSPALYPMVRSDIKTYSLTQGEFSFGVDDLFQGEVPDQLILGLVSSQGYIGAFHRSPYAFRHYHCNFISFTIDGQNVPGKPLTPNYETGNYIEAFQTLHQRGEVNIDREAYPKGFCLYVLDILENTTIKKRGKSRLELKFNKPLPESCTLVAYAKFQGLVQIDNSRNVYTF